MNRYIFVLDIYYLQKSIDHFVSMNKLSTQSLDILTNYMHAFRTTFSNNLYSTTNKL